MEFWIISGAVFIAVVALIGGVASMFRERADGKAEERLQMFTAAGAGGPKDKTVKPSLLVEPFGDKSGPLEALFKRAARLRLLFEQADTKMKPSQFMIMSAVLGVGGMAVGVVSAAPYWAQPLLAVTGGSLPLFYLMFKRRKRLKQFSVQLPDALELIGRALRAGHSLASGFDLVRQEMRAPIGTEFGRVFDEQNLGIAMDEALQAVTDRVPNLDLKFFATAVVLQRQTGGDLAEILDKIGHLIRERFKIYGQVQALTGEGRLSGAVLLGLPPALFLAVWKLNHDYIMLLFSDPMGKKMLFGGIVLQVIGAMVIRKIVNIKV